MKILITGGAGYLGNVLVEHLLAANDAWPKPLLYDVTVLDNLLYKQPCLTEYCWRDDFKFICGDVRDEKLFGKLTSENDIIIHLAAYVGMPACRKFPSETVAVNYGSSKFLADNISKSQVVIYPTTNSGYGVGQVVDDQTVHCTEETPLKPISLYGETKCDAEKALLDCGSAITLRLATVFGVSRRMRLDLLVNDMVYRAFNDKFIVLFESHFMRNFIHIRDIAYTFKFCIHGYETMIGQPFNVGNTNINMSKMNLCLAIKKQIPDFYITESPINKDPDQRNYVVSNAKLESLGWSCKFDLDRGVKELIRAYSVIKNVNTSFTNI